MTYVWQKRQINFLNVAAFTWNQCQQHEILCWIRRCNLNARIVLNIQFWKLKKMVQFSVFYVDRNSTLFCTQDRFDDETIVMNNDSQSSCTPQRPWVELRCPTLSYMNSIVAYAVFKSFRSLRRWEYKTQRCKSINHALARQQHSVSHWRAVFIKKLSDATEKINGAATQPAAQFEHCAYMSRSVVQQLCQFMWFFCNFVIIYERFDNG